MASRPFQTMFRGVGRNALDLPVAGLAAAAAVFFAFAMPQDVLSRIVSATGLPSLFAAAQPPLGLTARIAIAVGGAAITFGLVFFLLRLLDRSGLEKPAAEPQDGEAPRRRRDYHPDAPVRRPISAARDLGEPAPPEPPRAAAPVWLDAPEPEPEPVIEPKPEPEPAPAEMPTSIAALMERLEQGLARRQPRRHDALPAAAHAPAPQVFPEAPDDRLQSAIDSLQRLAARQS
ncbi:MAG TPA: hypothetical protein VGO55_10460 [Allosphingosinicella sp.]|nr:hypothetical protein [Allosphingosinicella sp.]